MDREENETEEFCTSCHIGVLRLHRTTYTCWHDGQFIVMPGVWVWCCDFCGDSFYDDEFLTRLVLLLGPEANLEMQRKWRTPGLDENWGADVGDRRRI